MVSLAEQVKAARAGAGVSQREFAKRCGHSRGAQQSYEVGRTKPTLYVFMTILFEGHEWFSTDHPKDWPYDTLHACIRELGGDPYEIAEIRHELVKHGVIREVA